MRIGLIARADNRGLGIQTWELWRHLQPAHTLVIDMGKLTPYEQHFSRYPGAEIAPLLNGSLPPGAMDRLIAASDVILSCETPYDYGLLERARAAGVRTAIQGNYEFLKWRSEPELPKPDLFISPSSWHLEDWPEPHIFLPLPIDREKLKPRLIQEADLFLHIAGHPAMNDRAGTRTLMLALTKIKKPISIRIQSQRGIGGISSRRFPRHVDLDIRTGDLLDYESLYAGADVLVAPRRYGGQSLPVNEAMSCGMPIIALDREPERSMLPAEGLIPARRAGRMRSQAGEIGLWAGDADALARRLERFISEPALVERLSKESDARAEALSWRALLPRWKEALASA